MPRHRDLCQQTPRKRNSGNSSSVAKSDRIGSPVSQSWHGHHRRHHALLLWASSHDRTTAPSPFWGSLAGDIAGFPSLSAPRLATSVTPRVSKFRTQPDATLLSLDPTRLGHGDMHQTLSSSRVEIPYQPAGICSLAAD